MIRNKNVEVNEIERVLQQKKSEMNNWMKRELTTRDGVEGVIDKFIRDALLVRAIQLVASGCVKKFKSDSDGIDEFFNKKDNTKLAMKKFRESTDKREIILHMQEPLEFEQKIFKADYDAKLDEFAKDA